MSTIHEQFAYELWERGDIGMKRDSIRDPEGEARVQALGRKHEAAGTVFSDPDFPPDDSSLFGSGGRAAHDRPSGSEWRRDKKPFLQDKTVVWKRPQEILQRLPSSACVYTMYV